MNSAAVAAQFHAHLADGFQKRQRFDVADRAADFDHGDVGLAGAQPDAALDFVGDVRDDLHRAAEVVAAPLLADHVFVDAPGGEVVAPGGGHADEAFVMAEIEIGFRAVAGDEHLAVLERAHGAGIDVDVGVELDQGDLEPRASSTAASEAAAMPLPREDTTPPVMKMNRVMPGWGVARRRYKIPDPAADGDTPAKPVARPRGFTRAACTA